MKKVDKIKNILPPLDKPAERSSAVKILARSVFRKELSSKKKLDEKKVLRILGGIMECNSAFPKLPPLRKISLANLYYRRLVRAGFVQNDITEFIGYLMGHVNQHLEKMQKDAK